MTQCCVELSGQPSIQGIHSLAADSRQVPTRVPCHSTRTGLHVCSYTWNGLDSLQQSLAKLQSSTTLTQAHSTASPSQSGTAEALSQSAAASGPAPGETWGSFAASGFQMQQQGGTPVGTPDRGQNTSSMTGFSTPGSVAGAEDGGAAPENGRRYTRKDKSLGLLSQRFIQLFLSTRTPVIALDDAAVALRGTACKTSRCCSTQLHGSVWRSVPPGFLQAPSLVASYTALFSSAQILMTSLAVQRPMSRITTRSIPQS